PVSAMNSRRLIRSPRRERPCTLLRQSSFAQPFLKFCEVLRPSQRVHLPNVRNPISRSELKQLHYRASRLVPSRRLKADAALHAIPVIAITAYELDEAEDKARAAGCDAYMAKPISPRQLLAKVREYLSSPVPTR